jgi:flagellar FliJ protein
MFEFNLQALLDLWRINEEKKQLALAEAMRELEAKKELLEDVKNQRLQMIREYYALEGHPVSSLRLVIYSENIAQCRDTQIAREEQCSKAEKDVEEKRLTLIEASKQKKMLGKLKEKKFTEYQQELNLKECKELDEAALLRYGGGPS